MEARQASRTAERQAYWRGVVEQALQSSMSIRQFCRQHGIHTSHFYYWRQRVAVQAPGRKQAAQPERPPARFALVSATPAAAGGSADSVLELVFEGGWRLCIRRGVDEQTLRTVLAVLAPPRA
jgi:hypothetical protein